MGAPLKLTSEALRNLAKALDELGRITAETFVDFAPYGTLHVEVCGATLKVVQRDGKYVIDDYMGD